MNKRRLTAIAEWLEAGAPHKKGVSGFDMSSFFSSTACGTTCCIAGAALQFYGDGFPPDWADFDVGSAQGLLGLNYRQAHALFYARSAPRMLESIDAAWAARCIRKLIETGKVDWRGTRRAS